MKVSEISAALTRIWDTLEGTNKMRASLFNLIVVIPKDRRTPYVRTITHKVIERLPSRVIFIILDKNTTEDRLDATVSVIPGARGEYDVVCDFIELHVTQKTQLKIPFVILPHLLPDLPVYVLWGEDPAKDNPLSHELEQWTERIIFDSEVTDNLSAFAQTLLQHYQDTDIADLNWARLENWRELLSATFYAPERLRALQQAEKISLRYNAHPTEFFCHTKIQALYLQSWLASQLGWVLKKATSHLFEYETLAIELHAEDHPELAPGTVISIDILAANQTHFAFSRDPDHPHQIKTIVCDLDKCDIPSKYIFAKSQTGLSLVNEITHTGTSPHFQKVLEFLTSLDPTCL